MADLIAIVVADVIAIVVWWILLPLLISCNVSITLADIIANFTVADLIAMYFLVDVVTTFLLLLAYIYIVRWQMLLPLYVVDGKSQNVCM